MSGENAKADHRCDTVLPAKDPDPSQHSPRGPSIGRLPVPRGLCYALARWRVYAQYSHHTKEP
jgi:hypothetical protein